MADTDPTAQAPFGEFLAEPVFVLTGDQDWTPDWALDAMLELTVSEDLPLHLFVTNRSPLLDSPPVGVTLGIHPNFLPGSTHGTTDDEVIDTCLGLVPGATTFRCHSFHENSRVVSKLVGRGLRAGSNVHCFLQPGLVPLVHSASLLQFPVVFEDDTFIDWAGSELDMTLPVELLLTPGLKVLNFHPSLVALNAPHITYYDEHRDSLFGPAPRACEPYAGRGAATVLRELLGAARAAGARFESFPKLVDDAHASLARLLAQRETTR